jgi:hypothetical protein
VCFNCIEQCPHGALSFRFLPPREGQITNPDAGRRYLLLGGLAGLLMVPFARSSGRATRDFSSQAIRPPGTVEEPSS